MDSTWVSSLQNGDMNALGQLYSKYRDGFVAMLRRKYGISTDEARDIYQVSILRMYNNIVNEKMVQIHSSVRPYLFSIGVNVYREKVRANMKSPLSNKPMEWLEEEGNSQSEKELVLHKETLLTATEKALEELEEPCKSILVRFYYFKTSMQQLMEEFGYKTEASAKNKKYKCLQHLRELIKEQNFNVAII